MREYNWDKKFAQYFFELVSLSPIAIVLGNLLPPIGLRIHYFLFGILFIISCIWLASNAHKKWILYVSGFYLIVQATLWEWNIKSYIDFFFGPFILMVLLDIYWKNLIPTKKLKEYTNRFVILAMVPISIAVLQFIGILPFQFLDADYVNFRIYSDGTRTPRPNGFLYHGSELCIIIYYMAVMQIHRNAKLALPLLGLFLFFGYTTLYKSILGTLIILILFYIVFIDRQVFGKIKVWTANRLYSYLSFGTLLVAAILIGYFSIVYSYTGRFFHDQLLTGRGAIWNIYFEGIKDFSVWNVLFGSGVGSEFSIFKNYATPELFYPLRISPILYDVHGTHNTLLSIFINSGIVGVGFIISIFYFIFKDLNGLIKDRQFKKKVIAFIIIPVFTFGITIPILEMAIFWPLIGFSIILWAESKSIEREI
ncbi:MAG: hypothetical protein ACPGEG_06275 [Salibacteraceae bacterium]